MVANQVNVTGGTLQFVNTTTNFFKFTLGAVNLSGGAFSVGVPTDNTSSVTGTFAMRANTPFSLWGNTSPGSGTGQRSVGAISSSSSTAIIQANGNGSSPYNVTLNLTASGWELDRDTP